MSTSETDSAAGNASPGANSSGSSGGSQDASRPKVEIIEAPKKPLTNPSVINTRGEADTSHHRKSR